MNINNNLLSCLLGNWHHWGSLFPPSMTGCTYNNWAHYSRLTVSPTTTTCTGIAKYTKGRSKLPCSTGLKADGLNGFTKWIWLRYMIVSYGDIDASVAAVLQDVGSNAEMQSRSSFCTCSILNRGSLLAICYAARILSFLCVLRWDYIMFKKQKNTYI